MPRPVQTVPASTAPRPPGATVRVVAPAADSDGAHAVLEVRAPGGHGAAEHLHEREDLVLVVVRGVLDVVVGGAVTSLGPGRAAFLPRGVPHRATAGPGGAHYLCVCLPGGFDEVVAALADPEPGPDDRAALLAAAGVHAVSGRW